MNGWKKSTYSQGDRFCVEVKEASGTVQVRDTQNRGLGHLSFTSSEWNSFLGDLKEIPLR
ncbi:DUF397 domain-containing protein [Nocardiopsis sp. CNT312]|uniref:DUF397 domain-containing protein n=1 Tax=Nocardiopsis sp. CNT312 TaxID=1137268 RepID=UPI00048CAC82|nr:DUF397 domain-containing protein [Nocardiopsis sp. CNT312]